MLRRFLLLLAISASSFTFAQDTTWVQTFTFDSISTRRADFVFPAELNSKRFEKVLMYYKLKCDPLTPWDQYDCGEWDYLAYTRIFDHTGDFDSVQVDSVQYLVNCGSNPSYDYDLWGYSYKNTYEITENNRVAGAYSNFAFNGTAGTASYPFDVTKKGGRYQMLVTAAELMGAGMTAGDIQEMTMSLGSLTGGGVLMHPRIAIKGTTDASISQFHETGFTEVYNLSRDGVSASTLITASPNDFHFYQPYTWNGTDNLIIEFSFDHGVQASNSMTFNVDNAGPGMGLNYAGKNGVLSFTGNEYAVLELSDFNMGDDVTIAFWAKGTGNTGVNTSVIEAVNLYNQRVMNIHMPWSNNRLYWDCGEGNGYDRIDQDMSGAGIDNEWHHWAFIKDQSTGEMKIMRDGVLWHSGTGLTRSVGYVHRIILGANKNRGNNWTGKIDEFQIFNTAVDEATITAWYQQKADASHPNWGDLLVYYDFDNEEWAQDMSQNDYLLMPSSKGLFDFSEYPHAGVEQAVYRPVIELRTGTNSNSMADVTVNREELLEPEVVFEYGTVDHHSEIINAFVGVEEGAEETYDLGGTMTSSTPFSTSNSITNSVVTHYEEPYEIIHDVEIGRFITPYGINFDLGPGGFTWIYDVTDYQMYLKDVVDLAAHNTQELIDLKFAFIEGIPPRDVHHREPIWDDWRSYKYVDLDDDNVLPSTNVLLSDTSSMFKIKTRFTGHGHNGSVNCCEWDSKDHFISVDGVSRFSWEIWEETACGDNPNISQGGTWPYAREGWCPGDLVKEYDHDLTPWVTPGSTVALDYDIEDVPIGDPAQGNGNYVVAMDLISYGAPNHQHDAAIVDILNPNNWEYYGKWNPSCSDPRVIIQNTGEQPLTSAKIRIWISYGDWIEYDWTGNLAFLQKETVTIPITDISWWQDYNGEQTFHAQIYDINGGDEYAQNDYKFVRFDPTDFIDAPNGLILWFTTNNKANENKWRLMDGSGTTIFERTSLNNSTDYKDTFDLAPGCYSIILEDTDSDGIGFWYSAQVEGETNGTFRVRPVGGPITETFPRDFGNFHRYDFTIGFALGLEEDELSYNLNVFPNPNDGNFFVELSGKVDNNATVQVFDLMGREIRSQKMDASANFASTMIEMGEMPAGHYILKVVTNDNVYTKEFVKK